MADPLMMTLLSNLTIELLAEKTSTWLAGLGYADKKKLNRIEGTKHA